MQKLIVCGFVIALMVPVAVAQDTVTYDQIQALPTDAQRAVLGKMTPDQRASIWIQHFARPLAWTKGISVEQKDLLRRYIAVIVSNPDFFDIPKVMRDPNHIALLRELEKEAMGLFSRELGRELFGPVIGKPRPDMQSGADGGH